MLIIIRCSRDSPCTFSATYSQSHVGLLIFVAKSPVTLRSRVCTGENTEVTKTVTN